jgi:hypothetical protein
MFHSVLRRNGDPCNKEVFCDVRNELSACPGSSQHRPHMSAMLTLLYTERYFLTDVGAPCSYVMPQSNWWRQCLWWLAVRPSPSLHTFRFFFFWHSTPTHELASPTNTLYAFLCPPPRPCPSRPIPLTHEAIRYAIPESPLFLHGSKPKSLTLNVTSKPPSHYQVIKRVRPSVLII